MVGEVGEKRKARAVLPIMPGSNIIATSVIPVCFQVMVLPPVRNSDESPFRFLRERKKPTMKIITKYDATIIESI
jgi:hypothetical protein